MYIFTLYTRLNIHSLYHLALATTGLIWARYSTQIVPINYNLMAVNMFVGASGIYQLARIYTHSRNSSVPPAA